MAAMSVIGIDFGNESCYIAVAKAGGIETIANDYSLRATPSYIAFSDKNRILGVAAKNQQVTNMKNTVYGLKRLIGRKFNDPQVKKELQMLPYSAIPAHNGDIRIKVNYLNEEHLFSPEQCVAMLFTKLKDISTVALQTPVNDCVISVPSYYTNNERKALLDAASIAGLNVLRLFNETTATALSYGIYKQDLPPLEEKPRNVIFVDCGHSCLQVFACAFNKGKLKMLASSADRDLGGRDIDYILAVYMAKEFQAKYKIDARTNARAFVRLLAEIEKIKKQMSANSTTLPVNIECFMEDKDVHGEIKRSDMESLCEHFFQCVENTLKDCLKKSGLSVDDIYAVEVVGGSTRIPRLKALIEKIYGKIASTTLNQDESVSRGCALQCAMLSPAVRVRDFSISDVQSYPIVVSWEAERDNNAGEMEVFPQNHAVPFSRLLTFYRQEPFFVTASYAANANIPYPDLHIGSWLIKDVKPDQDNKAQKIKVKVRINLNGTMSVSSAAMVELKDSKEDGDQSGGNTGSGAQSAMDTATTTASGAVADTTNGPSQEHSQHTTGNVAMCDDDAGRTDSGSGGGADDESVSGGGGHTGECVGAADTAAEQQNAGKGAEEGDDKNKKKKTKSVDLTIESNLPGYTQYDINNYFEQELKMIAADRQEKERADARNTLEEYVYELRSKLSSGDDLGAFLLDQDRDQLIHVLDDTETWLYDDGEGGGEDCQKHIYQGKLTELKGKGEPIQVRKVEWELRPAVTEGFEQSVQLVDKVLGMIRSGDPKYAHLSDGDVGEVEMRIVNAVRYLDETRKKIHSIPKHMNCPITVAQIRAERQTFDNATKAILNKPPPKAPSPPKDTAKDKEEHGKQPDVPEAEHKSQPDEKNKSSKDEKMDTS